MQSAGGLEEEMKVIQTDATINLDRFDEIRVIERDDIFQLVALKREMSDRSLMKGELILTQSEDETKIYALYDELQAAWIRNDAVFRLPE